MFSIISLISSHKLSTYTILCLFSCTGNNSDKERIAEFESNNNPNEDVISSCVGEIKSAEEFYSYEAKYNNSESKTLIPANISEEKSEEIRKLAIKAFKAIDGKGLSRVDFFIENETNKVYINEINTMPGFTNISMYPKLFNEVGVGYKELLDKVINLAVSFKKSP